MNQRIKGFRPNIPTNGQHQLETNKAQTPPTSQKTGQPQVVEEQISQQIIQTRDSFIEHIEVSKLTGQQVISSVQTQEAQSKSPARLEEVWIDTPGGPHSDKLTVDWLKKLPGAEKGMIYASAATDTEGKPVESRLRWSKVGNGPKLQVLIPPITLPGDHFRSLVEEVMKHDHASEFTFILLDPPGHAYSDLGSDKVNPTPDFLVKQSADGLERLVKQLEQGRSEPFESITLGGESSGATIATSIASKTPFGERVDGVVASNIFDDAVNEENMRENAPFADKASLGFDAELALRKKGFTGFSPARASLSFTNAAILGEMEKSIYYGGIPENRHSIHAEKKHKDGFFASAFRAGMATVTNGLGIEKEEAPWIDQLSQDVGKTYASKDGKDNMYKLFAQNHLWKHERESYGALGSKQVTIVNGEEDWNPVENRIENVELMGLSQGSVLQLPNRGHFASFDDPKQFSEILYHHHGIETSNQVSEIIEQSNQVYFEE